MLEDYLPTRINSGPWITAWSLLALRKLPCDTDFILPICSIDTPYEEIVALGDHLLPPLFHEALTADLQSRIVQQILHCFPAYGDAAGNARRLRVVEVSRRELTPTSNPRVVAFSVDTAVEEHGPHLPLGTDTIQSYSVLNVLKKSVDGFEVARPLEYGQLTWGLPFGFSVDLTAQLLTEYVSRYARAIAEWKKPEAVYVVDVHGSITHRQAIIDGLQSTNISKWAFRWLHEPLAEFASARGDQHAGGVETILVERVAEELLDPKWWPKREQEIAAGCMTLEQAVELTPNLTAFADYVDNQKCNGIIGDIANYHSLDAELMFARMLNLANEDVANLLSNSGQHEQQAGSNLW